MRIERLGLVASALGEMIRIDKRIRYAMAQQYKLDRNA